MSMMSAMSYEDRIVQDNNILTEVGSPLRTLKGIRIKRSSVGVGKYVGRRLYFHKNYLDYICDKRSKQWADSLKKLYSSYKDQCPFPFNCLRFDTEFNSLAFVECPNFDKEREPVVGKMWVVSNYMDRPTLHNYPSIYHHKWEWVMNDYTGFDVKESWEWSRKWLNVLTESANGSSIDGWNAQLEKFNLL